MIPASGSYRLANARVHRSLTPGLAAPFDADGFALAELAVADGKIASIVAQAKSNAPADAIDLAGRIVLPCFVDCHTHIDKGHIWPRKPNPDGTFMGALNATGADRTARWSGEDVARRMDFSLRSAYAHGTKAVRTHLDSVPPQEEISWPVFEAMREKWRGRIELQAACLLGIEGVRDKVWFEKLAKRVAAAKGVLGVVTYMVPDLEELLDQVFAQAIKHGLDLDFHADETDDVAAVSLKKIAEASLWNGFEGNILVGHCCSLARQPDLEVLDTLDKVAKARLAVVSLPMCNLYLQDRRNNQTTPRWRGVTLLHEMKARGIKVAVASDNTRDPFYAYGDLDMLEVYRMATRILHFDHPVGDWPKAVAATPAEVMRLDDAGTLATGGSADFIVFKGRNWTELLSRPESDRVVVREGRAIERQLPDYAELDELMVG
ncbi:cytosine deaminase [Mesorhizobium sp. M2D.F.Ca.ET.185.01.1.1]|uniref:cytosine deaminase n=1 Tax=unclassified Mesorhizobium TaxID=325217 RepID=UPI000FCBEE13|nr:MULTISPECIES: cytosine deaminase [unclassified Mesorhizobium]TGP79413.1 cytosine deaminase [bacterium M00.F.Ca.ET.227.01.1.1]TGQ00849.1 cytosine deaminase [bacterium M00.F.Ca.ET.221.01.1.1]TGQ02630.1 cytosine deaminase [bacterium M00.F.Ca.ET.222.01.1.1]TGU12523.1 cytosine deaminase [bacterium M00.F.Ca.ET.163.01.1.1]TGU34497.1 cytosine deaminase [bacterium M00.F.Ca.ET.156.01.1.1]TGU46460.1 cytosine deaminase [bacterium M00.F.Ca.ET.146.01.1.1]TGV72242.1 cytosine deaminase [Mesorhizobium sp.